MCKLLGEARAVEMNIAKGGLKAYKICRVDRSSQDLTALFHHYRQKRKTTYTLGVRHRARFYGTKYAPDQSVPSRLNASGFYAFYTYAEAMKARKEMAGWIGRENKYVIARVRLFGKAVWYANGLRAAQMIVESVCGWRPKK